MVQKKISRAVNARGHEFQSYVKFFKADGKIILEKIQAMGGKNKGNVEEVGSKKH
jgi:hypothetical protein